MEYRAQINGMTVTAHYSDRSIRQVFVPLLRLLTELQARKRSRLLVLLAAPPAAGKSTLLSFLYDLSRHTPGVKPVTVIGMDGFHRYQSELQSRTLLRDGRQIPMVEVKGAPETFDLPKLTAAVEEVASGRDCLWPDYNRLLHNPVEDALRVDGSIVILEGNYLLLDEDGWRELRHRADYTVAIRAEEQDLYRRLVQRKIASGAAPEAAEAFVTFSDLPNARRVLEHSVEADLTLQMTHDGEYLQLPMKGEAT